MELESKAFANYSARFLHRKTMYKKIASYYKITKCLYPGSYIDIFPSFYIQNVTYVDNFKKTTQFFKDITNLEKYIQKNNATGWTPSVRFIFEDYWKITNIPKVELIISQFGGFVGQATKKFLKKKGLLLCNDSHGDASLANLDPEFKLIGIFDEQMIYHSNDLDKYFTFKRKIVSKKEIILTMKGPKYKLMASNYVFQKI